MRRSHGLGPALLDPGRRQARGQGNGDAGAGPPVFAPRLRPAPPPDTAGGPSGDADKVPWSVIPQRGGTHLAPWQMHGGAPSSRGLPAAPATPALLPATQQPLRCPWHSARQRASAPSSPGAAAPPPYGRHVCGHGPGGQASCRAGRGPGAARDAVNCSAAHQPSPPAARQPSPACPAPPARHAWIGGRRGGGASPPAKHAASPASPWAAARRVAGPQTRPRGPQP